MAGASVDGGWAGHDGTVHIDRSEGTVGNGAAQRTSEGKARVKVKPLWLLNHSLLGSCEGSDGSHCECGVERAKRHRKDE
jgi:hypothetical protein